MLPDFTLLLGLLFGLGSMDAEPPEPMRALLGTVAIVAAGVWMIRTSLQRALGLRGDDLHDVTQDFFTRLLERDFLARLREERSLRGFLRTAARRHLINYRKSRAHRPAAPLSPEVEAELADPGTDGTERLVDEEFRVFYVEGALERTRRVLVLSLGVSQAARSAQ